VRIVEELIEIWPNKVCDKNALQDLNTMLTGSTHHISSPTIHTTIEALMDETLQLSLKNELVPELPPLSTSSTDLDKSLTAGVSL